MESALGGAEVAAGLGEGSVVGGIDVFVGGTSVSAGAGLTTEGIDVSVAGTNVAVEIGPQPSNKNASAIRNVVPIYRLNMADS